MFPISEVSRMPTHELGMSRSNSSHSQQRLNDSDIPEIRVKTAYNGQVGGVIIILISNYYNFRCSSPTLITRSLTPC